MFEIKESELTKLSDKARIVVVGVGGGGCNAVNTMIREGLTGVEYVVANTDSQALNANLAPVKIQLGAGITKGLGAGANPEVGRKAALDEYEQLGKVLESADMVFVTAGMGGGTGTGAAPVIAKLAKELGALTVGVVTKPFSFEGKKRMRQALDGIKVLEESVDSLITIPNQKLLHLAGESMSLVDTFRKADQVLLNAVRGISDLINNTGHINADFADVKTVMSNKGLALMGTGMCAGPERAIKAATEAISSPLLEDISINGATGIIINISGSDTLTMFEMNEAVTLIMEAADENAEIIWGTVIDNTLGENVKVTVVATGLGLEVEQKIIADTSSSLRAAPVQQTITREVAAAPVAQVAVEEVKVASAPTLGQFLSGNSNAQTESVASYQEEREEIEQVSFDTGAFKAPAYEEAPVQQVAAPVAQSSNEASPLMQSIRDAANRYEQLRTNGSVAGHPGVPASNSSAQTANSNTMGSVMAEQAQPSRVKSIAEKLGFMNFDEEELDRPTFLRKSDAPAEKPAIRRFERPSDL